MHILVTGAVTFAMSRILFEFGADHLGTVIIATFLGVVAGQLVRRH